ncbi:MAG TPA: peptidoglycan editing factor PgeF [Usitatibacter sp.]|nr:peptidoglycan editing factor PgeF [Usitatibacter sp.]
MSLESWITPDWPAPRNVRAFFTTRAGGVSEGEYASLNLGMNSGDDPQRVARNRAVVRAHLPADPFFLAQVHGAAVLDPGTHPGDAPPKADAAVTATPGATCVVLTADCMPVFLCDAKGTRVGVAHAGWRGMAAGVLENAVAAIGAAPADVIAWMGPAIGPDAFEVGPEVREAFMAVDAGSDDAFRPHRAGKYMADLYTLARRRLARAGVTRVHGGGFCTYRDRERFFSYRRVKESGRMGAFIWLEP